MSENSTIFCSFLITFLILGGTKVKSLKHKITIPVLLVATIGILLLSTFTFSRARKIIVADVEQIAQSKVEKLVTLASGKTEKWSHTINMISSSDIAKEFDLEKAIFLTDLHYGDYKEIEPIEEEEEYWGI